MSSSVSSGSETRLAQTRSDAAARSADQDFTDQFGNAILHDTGIRLIPMTVDLRVLPTGRYAVTVRAFAYAPTPTEARGAVGKHELHRFARIVRHGIRLDLHAALAPRFT